MTDAWSNYSTRALQVRVLELESSMQKERAKLAELREVAEADGVTLRLARAKPEVVATLAADGIVDALGAHQIHGNVHAAVEAQLAADREGSATTPGA